MPFAYLEIRDENNKRLPIGEIGHTDLVERVHGAVVLGFARPSDPTELAICAHRDNIERVRREVPID